MREILFKAKGRNNGKWVIGYYVLFRKCHYILPMFNDDVFYRYEKWPFYGCEEWIEVDPSTVCQYTGLTDKNGRKIWENDTVYVTDDEGCSGQVDTGVGEIDFLEGMWYVSGDVQNGLYDIEKCMLIEVIGNIFDNPELLNPRN